MLKCLGRSQRRWKVLEAGFRFSPGSLSAYLVESDKGEDVFWYTSSCIHDSCRDT